MERLAAHRPTAPLRIGSWSCRWLPPISCPRGHSKAQTIQQGVRQIAVVLLQETHLDVAACEVWAAGLHGCLFAACATLTSMRGGQSGGVAVCYPDQWQLLESRVLVPGCALEVLLRMGGPEV